jgi:hypothetical protein
LPLFVFGKILTLQRVTLFVLLLFMPETLSLLYSTTCKI